MRTPAERVLLGITAAGTGWLGGMGFLKVVHPWAYETEFRWWAFTSAVYAVLLLIVIAGWIAASPTVRVWSSVMQFILAATLLPLFLMPFTAGFSIVLLMSGHTYVIAAIAAMVYLGIAAQSSPSG